MEILYHLHLQPNLDRNERWLSAGLGGILIMLARQDRPGRSLYAVGGAALLLRAATGISLIYRALHTDARQLRTQLHQTLIRPGAIRLQRSIAIRRPVEEVFQFCDSPANLQLVIQPLERVERRADSYQRLHFRGPKGWRFGCDLEITHDQENSNLISWRSRPNANVAVQGFLNFKPGRSPQETELRATMSYEPPLGLAGKLAAQTLAPLVDQLLTDTLRNIRQILEAQVAPSLKGQPAWAAAETPVKSEDFEDRYRQPTDAQGRVLH